MTHSSANQSHDTIKRLVQDVGRFTQLHPTLPNAASLKKMAEYIEKLAHMLLDYEQHNTELLHENRELYRQLEVSLQENDQQQEEITALEQLVEEWQRYAEGSRDLFTPPPPAQLHRTAAKSTTPPRNNEETCER